MAVSLDRQLVIFSAESARPVLADLAGLLMGSGQVSKMGGTARVSVPVSQAWRVHALAAEFAARGLAISWEQADVGGYWVRTSYSSALVRLAAPTFLDGLRLRLWFLASGELEEGEEQRVSLRTPHPELAAEALAPLGLEGVVKAQAIRLSGEARRRRLADLIGERPATAPREAWPIPSRPQAPASTASRPQVARPRRAGDGEGLWELDPVELPEIESPDEPLVELPKPRTSRRRKSEVAAEAAQQRPAEVGDLEAKRRARAEEAAGLAAPMPRRARAAS